MERLDELNLGIRGQTTGEDMDHLPVGFPAMADPPDTSVDIPQAFFDAPWMLKSI